MQGCNDSICYLPLETAQKSAKSSVAAGSAILSDDELRREIAGVRGGWQRWNRKAYGIAKSLYERHPVSGRVAGSPVADAFAIVARKDSALLALADGVNWGPKAATAARAALHGSLRHLHVALYNPPTSNIGVKDTKVYFLALSAVIIWMACARFCINPSSEGKGESAKRSSRAGGGASSNRGESSIPTSKSTGNVVGETGPGRPKLPVVEAHQRHALTLLRMEDLLVNGVSGEGAPEKGLDAVDLCHRLVEFATRLTAAKRHILEDPELYVDEAEGLTGAPAKAEQRGRRRKVCERLASVPGKLDHASVVAYVVGEFTGEEEVVDASKATLCEEETELEEGEDKNGSEKLMSSSLTKETFLVQSDVLEGKEASVGKVPKSKKETAEKKEEDDVNGWVDKDGLTNVEDSINPVATELFETGL
ncbi:hypothetical protein J437_LFUL015849 [Ladona fulva]|uniref:Uncharacterized protein n=1 Tax=Ladona fulva TaxID=123851 RepID=A0A8K0P682_LADFU|nr:hypothetical protein J437_LFUL015849 [Ladona fulva]